jgi:hypothetical protein
VGQRYRKFESGFFRQFCHVNQNTVGYRLGSCVAVYHFKSHFNLSPMFRPATCTQKEELPFGGRRGFLSPDVEKSSAHIQKEK